MEHEIHGIVNYNIAVKKHGDDIIFLRKIVRGGADDSYGIAVAKLAGIPAPVVKRANEILKELESGSLATVQTNSLADQIEQAPLQIALGAPPVETVEQPEHPALELLRQIDPDELTPKKAMDYLYELKQLLKS